jgi:hypothetical protein
MTFLRYGEDSGSKRSIEQILKYPEKKSTQKNKVIMKRHMSREEVDPV